MLWTFLANDSTAAAQTDTDMAWPTDQTLTFDQSGRPIMPNDYELIWAYGLGLTVTRMRLLMPWFLPYGRPVIRPIEGAANPSGRPQFAEYFRRPLKIKAAQPIRIQRTNTTAVAEQDYTVLTVGDGQFNAPPGDVYTLRFTTTFTPTVNAWTASGKISPDDTLTPGIYSIVGIDQGAAGGVASRLIFPGAPLQGQPPQIRPGIIVPTTLTSQGNRYMRWGRLGEYGRFNSLAPPQLETYWNAATANPELYLDVVLISAGVRTGMG